jgi:LPS O-antigen subunit length determinant protein (WzzB/FepE family)
MHKKIILDNNDIDLINLIKVIWDKKLLIFLVTFLSFIFSVGTVIYYKNKIKPKTYNFETALSINLLSNTELLYFERFNDLISSTSFNYILNQNSILKKIEDKIFDSNLTKSFIKNNIFFQNRMSKLNNDEFNLQLNNYMKLFILEGDNNNFKLKFYWDNQFESQKILEDYMNYLSVDLKNEIFENLDFISLRLKEIQTIKYKIQLDHLIKQRDLAIKMGIEKPFRLFFDCELDLNAFDFTYNYGYLAINAEIEKLKLKQNGIELEFLNNEINYIKNNQNINWVNYSLISSIEKKVHDKSIKIIIISSILGLMIGVILALTLHAVKFRKKYK